MKKSYNQLLTATVLIILYAAALILFCWNSLKEPNDITHFDENYIIQPEVNTIQSCKRMNIVLLGIESNARADTIMFISYDRVRHSMDIISIPRDTYFHLSGYDKGDQRKINAAYGRKKEEGCVDAVRKILADTPVDYYISVDYEAVVEVIDAIGGVELEVPLDMKVGGIEIAKGNQVLYGPEALQYLRYRKEYPDGDLGRIKAQQKLIKVALNKIKYLELPQIITKAFNSVRTNMPVKYLIEYVNLFKNDEHTETTMYMLPGFAMYKSIGGRNWSYYFHDSKKVEELMNKIYGIESIEEKEKTL